MAGSILLSWFTCRLASLFHLIFVFIKSMSHTIYYVMTSENNPFQSAGWETRILVVFYSVLKMILRVFLVFFSKSQWEPFHPITHCNFRNIISLSFSLWCISLPYVTRWFWISICMLFYKNATVDIETSSFFKTCLWDG